MNNMPRKLREDLSRDQEYARGYCIYHGRFHGPGVKTEWHHNMIFAGRQVQERFAILSICKEVHDKANWKQVRERLDWIMLNRASNDDLVFYSRAGDLIRRREILNEKYGPWQK